MRILFTTAWYPNRKVAGDGVFIQKHAQAVARLNDVAVLMVQTDEAKHDYSIEVETKCVHEHLTEVLVYVPKTWREIPVLTGMIRLFWLLAGYLKGYLYIKKHYWEGQRPDLCHVNVLTRAAGLPWLLKQIYGIPYIITEHWSRYMRPGAYPASGLQLVLGRRFVRGASYVCPVSLNLEQGMKQWKLENRHYTRVSNMVDTDVFTLPEICVGKKDADFCVPENHTEIADKDSASADAKTRFVHVSWMRDDSKNISGILRVLSKLKQRRSDFELRLVGEGNDKAKLMDYAHELGLLSGYSSDVSESSGEDGVRQQEDVVTFVEAKSGAALAEELQHDDCLLMFSNFENQPVSVLEALACGLPVIATAVGSIPGMLTNNRGICVKPGDEAELLAILDGFLTQRAKMTAQQKANRTLASQRREYVVNRHSPEVISRQFDALYRASKASTC